MDVRWPDGAPPPRGRDDRDGGGSRSAAIEAATDLGAYPVLTEQVGTSGGPGPAPGGGAGGQNGSALGQIVSNALRDVLGWRPDARNSKAFVGALNQAFELKQ